ncbi:MAG: PQQ-binding-like beta-propeller repeat protein [Candidatus Aminicenantes bacterium]|nr:MAG: PQQ-binding-like beta-propeller repeat protein [Candidatus Aminicenantes bacterium]
MMNCCKIFMLFLLVITAGLHGYPAPTEPGATASADRLMGMFNCPGPIRSTPVSARETIYIGSDNGYLYALNRKTARPRWSFQADAAAASKPAVAGDLVFFSTKRGTLYAIYQHQHQLEGKEAWRFTSQAKTVKLYGGGWDYFVSSPVVAGDLVIFGSGDHHIYALHRQKGSLVWKYDTGAVVRSTPALHDNKQTLFCGTLAGELLALQVKSGKVKWKFKTSGNQYFPKGELLFEPLVYKNTVYVGSRDASFYAINAADGTLRWKASDQKGAWYTTAAAADHMVFAASSDGHYVQALDYSTGKEKWKFHAQGLIFSTPFIHEGVIYMGSHDGYVYAVDALTGKLEWRYRVGDDVLGSAMIDKEMLIIGCDDGVLYGLRPGKTVPKGKKKTYRAVYWAPRLDSLVKNRVANTHDPQEVYRFFRDSGYETLDAPGLEQFLKKRISDQQASSSVIVLASLVFPSSIYQAQGSAPALLRQYLDAGGSIVSVGYPPFMFMLKEDTNRPAVPVKDLMTALSIDEDFFYHGFSYYDAYMSYPTEAGKRLGMPQWWCSGYGVDPKKVTIVLGIDEHGRATAWIKSYGGPQETGLIRLWGNDRLPQDMNFIKKIAEGAALKPN